MELMCCRGSRRTRVGRRVSLPARRTEPPKAEPPTERPKPKTYEIIPIEGMHGEAIKCLKCGMTSYNPNDAKHKYCGNCHEFHES